MSADPNIDEPSCLAFSRQDIRAGKASPVIRGLVDIIDSQKRRLNALAAVDQASIITEQEQLDAVPAGSVLIDSYRVHLGGDVYQKSGTGTYWQAGPQGEFKTIQLPARVLQRGTE